MSNATFYFTFLAKSHTSLHAQKIYLRKREGHFTPKKSTCANVRPFETERGF
ncbi:hypothetical protein HMPREF9069_01475 [Atopobium sp. oral taxon 810 str. F0209]|nr:hypothetical protein HMPREF9069_01475 [Atopobium sp. oral taxon 810 str. F0209]